MSQSNDENNSNYHHSQSHDDNDTHFRQTQPNNPNNITYQQPLNFHDPNFDTQSSHSNHSYFPPHWNLQQPGTNPIDNAVPSPTPSIRNRGSAIDVSPQNRPRRNGPVNVDPFISLPIGRTPPTIDNSFSQTMGDYLHTNAPWNPMDMRGNSMDRSVHVQPVMNTFHHFGPGSDHARSLPDSGYVTIPPSYSDPGRAQEYPPSFLNYVNKSSAPSERTDRSAQSNSKIRGTRRDGQIECGLCNGTSKCPSDHKKHMLRHNKIWKCTEPNCRRAGKGFGTSNDLERHRKSVHRIGATQNSWKCASDNCRNKEKIWPRLDNFKQHINRMHKEEDDAELIRRSTYHDPLRSYSALGSKSLGASSLDTALAGIGEKQGTSNEFDEPASGISLTPDQESNLWNFYNSSSTTEISVSAGQYFARPQDPPTSTILSTNSHILPHHRKPIQEVSRYSKKATEDQNELAQMGHLEPLHVLADAVSSQPQRTPQNIPELSNAPQTKSAQALDKITRILLRNMRNPREVVTEDQDSFIHQPVSMGRTKSNSTSSDGSASSPYSDQSSCNQGLRYENDDPGYNDKDTITEKDLIEVTRAISEFMKKPSRFRSRTSSMSIFNTHKCNEKGCGSAFTRACELRKHMKRHTKPYGCTFAQCNKKFGSKSDWKRHERDQHFQPESYVCQFTRTLEPGEAEDSTHQCLTPFPKEQPFKKHYEKEHAKQLRGSHDPRIKASKIGKNHLNTFWCGFCKKIIVLKEKLTKGWAERFDHIDGHFKTQKIEEWFCPESGCFKGERETKAESEADESSSDSEGAGDGKEQDEELPAPVTTVNATRRQISHLAADGILPQSKQKTTCIAAHGVRTVVATTPSSSSTSPDLFTETAPVPRINGRKRPRSREDGEDDFLADSSRKRGKHTKTRTELNTYCCECGYGPLSKTTHLTCLTCVHHLCNYCPTRPESVNMDDEWGSSFAGFPE